MGGFDGNPTSSREQQHQQHQLDPTQLSYLSEQCIVVNDCDNIISSASKKDCHLLTNINNGMIHRAFSVLLFDSANRLLIQKRAKTKITFPGLWTNTCCSHPLSTPVEMNGIEGAKKAAVRKVKHELGIESTVEDYHFITKILYSGISDAQWGEQELDYIFIARFDRPEQLNLNEVEEIKYISLNDLKSLFLQTETYSFTPWFKLLCDNFLLNSWWSDLDKAIEQSSDPKLIHNFLSSADL